jgi:2-acylglycerol O-acyltransferase 2
MYSMAVWMTVYTGALWYASSNGHPWIRTALLLYLPFCISDPRPRDGGGVRGEWSYRFTDWCRSIPMYKNVARWFPVTLVKTTDLDPAQSYIFLYHPHGIISMGANTALNTNGCDFDKVFPGVQRHGVTLNVTFWAPLFREWMLLLGMISANKRTLTSTLNEGRSVVLVPGGAKEALSAHKHNFRLHVKTRRGFVQLARETGALAVPVLGFGENEAFETLVVSDEHHRRGGAVDGASSFASALRSPPGLLHYCQHRLYKILTFTIPILTSILPNRNPIHVVVGAPVKFKGTTLEECHAEYLEALRGLYDHHKAQYGYHDMKLEFV